MERNQHELCPIMNCVRCGDDITGEFFAGVDGSICARCLKKIYIYHALRSKGLLSTMHQRTVSGDKGVGS